MAQTTTIQIGDRTFILDRDKAEAAYAAKRVINGRDSMFFNILPVKYGWAYDLYKTMKANHRSRRTSRCSATSSSGATPRKISETDR